MKTKYLVMGLIALVLVSGAIATTSIRDNLFQIGNNFFTAGGISLDSGSSINLSNTLIYLGTGTGTDIQAKINSCPISGCQIYLTGYTYILSSSLNLKSNVQLLGVGNGTVLYLYNGVNSHVINSTNQKNIRISNLVIDGNKDNQVGSSDGIHLVNVSNSLFDSIYIKNTNNDALSIEQGENNKFDYIAYNIGKIGTGDGEGLTLRSNFNYGSVIAENIEGDCVLLKGNNNNIKAIVKNCKNAGISISNIGGYDCNNNIIDIITNFTGTTGVFLESNDSSTKTVKNNKIYGIFAYANTSGIYTKGRNASSNIFEGIVYNNRLDGLFFEGDGGKNIVKINSYGNGRAGISIKNSSYNKVISETYNNSQYGVHLWFSNFTTLEVSSLDNGYQGAYIESTYYTTLSGIFSNPGHQNIDLLDSFYSSISNVVTINGSYGIRERGISDYNIFDSSILKLSTIPLATVGINSINGTLIK